MDNAAPFTGKRSESREGRGGSGRPRRLLPVQYLIFNSIDVALKKIDFPILAEVVFNGSREPQPKQNSKQAMNTQAQPPAPSALPPAINTGTTRPRWRIPLALLLGTVSFFMLFIGEISGMAIAFFVVGACFLLSQYLLSRGRTLRESWATIAALNFVPLCLGTLVVVLEQKSGAWWQGVSVVTLGLMCSFAGAALAARTSLRTRLQ